MPYNSFGGNNRSNPVQAQAAAISRAAVNIAIKAGCLPR